jgi:hypothetical protein
MNTFIADSGASAHMVHSKSLLSDFIEEESEVKIGDNTEVKSLGTGTFKGYHVKNTGEQVDVALFQVLLVPDLWVNLSSITKATLNKDCKATCEDNLITVNTNSHQLYFDKIFPHGHGQRMSTDFLTHTECANLTLTKATYQDLHHKLGHPHKQAVINGARFAVY